MLPIQPGEGSVVRSSTGAFAQYRLDAPLPPGAGGQWCRVRLHLPTHSDWWAKLELIDPARAQIVRSCFLGPLRRRPDGTDRATLVHVPANAETLTLYVYGAAPEHAGQGALRGAVPRIERLSRAGATARLLWHGRRLIAFALSGKPQGRLGRLRAVLGQAPARAGQAPPYAVWIALCEPALPPPPVAPALPLQTAIVGAHAAGQSATLASLRAQTLPHPEHIFVTSPKDWAKLTAPLVIILQAGEVLAPQALAWFAHAAATCPHATLITADCDALNARGDRSDPLFKPTPDKLLLRTGLLTQGACAVRWPAQSPDLPVDAHEARLILAQIKPGTVANIPRILTHIGPSAEFAPYSVQQPRRDPHFLPRVTALIPTVLRSPHVTSCLRQIMHITAYPAFTARLVLSDAGHAKPHLRRAAERLPRVHICEIAHRPFNYAAVNNAAAEQLSSENASELLLLMNDDVEPLNGEWLDAMVAHMQDPTVGIVGARLLYGNGMVQHEGVIMGLAHLCEHAGRLRPASQTGPHGLGLMDRDVSAVTAACLLIRADVYRALGGMDPGFAIALNDVDLCLRARRAGWRVVYCASAVLYHYESLSLGRHYAGGRAVLEALEVRRLRDRWDGVISDDPCYSPLASLEPGREWQPAFPPRGTTTPVRPPNPAAKPS